MNPSGSTAVDNTPPKQEPLTLVRGFFVASSTNSRQRGTVQDSNRAAAHSAVSKATVQRRRPLPAAEAGRSCWGRVLIFQSPAKGLRKNQQTQPVALLSPRFPTARNVYQERCRPTHSVWGLFSWWMVQDENRKRAKAGYHYGSGILPFAILNRVWYTRLSSTNLHLED